MYSGIYGSDKMLARAVQAVEDNFLIKPQKCFGSGVYSGSYGSAKMRDPALQASEGNLLIKPQKCFGSGVFLGSYGSDKMLNRALQAVEGNCTARAVKILWLRGLYKSNATSGENFKQTLFICFFWILVFV